MHFYMSCRNTVILRKIILNDKNCFVCRYKNMIGKSVLERYALRMELFLKVYQFVNGGFQAQWFSTGGPWPISGPQHVSRVGHSLVF